MKTFFESSNLQRPSWLSPGAKIAIKGKNKDSKWGEARNGGRLLAKLNWTAAGRLFHEVPFDAAGKRHGLEIERDETGKIAWCAPWVHGSMHGPVIRFNRRGRPLLVTYFVRGCGTDIWTQCDKVTEVREMLNDNLHGLLRWGDPRRPYEEGHFFHGKRQGIFREWVPDGHLRPTFPRFYLENRRVSRSVYEVAQTKDPSLPTYKVQDNLNKRAIPRAVREALERAKCLRRELALVDHVRRLTPDL